MSASQSPGHSGNDMEPPSKKHKADVLDTASQPVTMATVTPPVSMLSGSLPTGASHQGAYSLTISNNGKRGTILFSFKFAVNVRDGNF